MPPSGAREADEIILFAFRQIECPIPEDVRSVSQLAPEQIVYVCAKSLWHITDGSAKFPVQLPSGIAARHRICTDMASKIKELGYAGDCGYNQLLYPTEDTTRTILTWLMSKLPRAEEDRAEEVLGPNALLNRRITTRLQEWRLSSWRLPFCTHGSAGVYRALHHRRKYVTYKRSGARHALDKAESGKPLDPTLIEEHTRQIVTEVLYQAKLESAGMEGDAVVASANTRSQLIKKALGGARRAETSAKAASAGGAHSSIGGISLVDLIQNIDNATTDASKGKARGGARFTHAAEFAQDAPLTQPQMDVVGRDTAVSSPSARAADTHEQQAEADASRKRVEMENQTREEELAALKAQLQVASDRCEEVMKEKDSIEAHIRQDEAELAQLAVTAQGLEREYLVKRRTLEMLPKASENIAKLQEICASSARKVIELAQEWETHRRPLVERIQGVKEAKSRRKERCKGMVEEMKKYRSEMERMIQDLREKEDRQAVLAEELTKLPKNINRSLYTYRIMDIIASIHKQKAEINKIIVDIREVQKTINSSSGTLQRADAVAEDKIYNAANGPNRDESTVTCYRCLTTFRENFASLIEAVRQVGQRDAEARDLEVQIDQELSRVSATNFERIRNDLEQVQAENAQLIARIRATR